MKQEDPEKLGDESAYEDATEMSPRIRRGDESKGDGEERDVAGAYADDHPQNTRPGTRSRVRRAPRYWECSGEKFYSQNIELLDCRSQQGPIQE